jgi:hypothetical protein
MSMLRLARSLVAVLCGLAVFDPARADEPPSFEVLGREYQGRIRPLISQFCLRCHSTQKHKGDFDLEAYTAVGDFRRDPEIWQKLAEAIDSGEMPPKESEQPSPVLRSELRRWVAAGVEAEAAANRGDPGRVVMRRLTNVEYDNATLDLTGIDLRPAREFPADPAAGEGFTNVSDALVMSPSILDKYLAAAKGIAAHAVLLPDGLRFSEKTSRPDWTNELLNQIKDIYRRYTQLGGNTQVKLQGLVWDSKGGGLIPLESYLAAAMAYRDRVSKQTTIAAIAAERHLSADYLQTLFQTLQDQSSSLLLDRLRERWRAARSADIPALAAEIRVWQGVLTSFGSVGHFKPWQQPRNPIVDSQPFRIKLSPSPGANEVVLRLTTWGVGAHSAGNLVVWKGPRLEGTGRPPISLRNVPDVVKGLDAKRRTLGDAARYLAAADAWRSSRVAGTVSAIAQERRLDPEMLAAWLDMLGLAGSGTPPRIDSLFTNRMERGGGYNFVKSWGSPATPSVVANSSNREVRIPGILRPHSVAMHPSPTRNVVVAWRSPMSGPVRIEAHAVHTHPECGNGLTWALELRRESEHRRLRAGEIDRGKAARIDPVERVTVHVGDLISLLIGPRGEHSCDLTEVDLTITELEGNRRRWNLAHDVSSDILSGNPHADSLGHRDVWHFHDEDLSAEAPAALATVPAGSVLDRWRDASQPGERRRLAEALEHLLKTGESAAASQPDTLLYRQLTSLGGPLLGRVNVSQLPGQAAQNDAEKGRWSGQDLQVQAPTAVEFHLPADFIAGREFLVTAELASNAGSDGSVQAQVFVDESPGKGSLNALRPILVGRQGRARKRIEGSFDEFRRVFPAALCYSQIVPVDEVVTLALYHREDDNLARLMLNEAERKRLDRLWEELWYVSQEALKVEVGYVQFMEYTTQDSDPNLFKHLKKPIVERAAALRKQLVDNEPKHLDALLELADRAYRRPLLSREKKELRALYGKLRKQGLDHDSAFRLTLARVLIAPAFLFHVEQSAQGALPQPVSDWELACRLSFFLSSSMPDTELRRLADEGRLHDPTVLAGQTRRMISSARTRALATEFACQWLDLRGFDQHNEKSEQVFPEFAALRGAMYEEAVRFFLDLFQRNGSLLEVIDTDHTFLNEPLARHYGIAGVTGQEWRRVEGIKKQDRGGILGMAALLSKQSGASRTSPILRGNWLLEMLLGEKIPKPPKNVPQLPESELDTGGLSMRQITERHRRDESCAKCHQKIDPFGFALESFDAVGRRRKTDLGGRPIDTRVQLADGTKFADLSGLRDYLLAKRRDDFVRHFCRKILGYALGRSVQLSDKGLLDDMERQLATNDYRLETAILTIVGSPQFRLRRGLASPLDQASSF